MVPDHKCAQSVGLNVLEEVYALFSEENTNSEELTHEAETEPYADEQCCCIQCDPATLPVNGTLKFQGLFMGTEVLILLDSGSSSSFISEGVVHQLGIPVQQCNPLTVRVANAP